ncbi:Omp28-related outer membrane protein [Bacteroidales bacterium OttesenSCG-928-I21]|nr:Omp28-related outer membrane protein [Bacteroidales bacterium OttesenSCG-928-I21]
MKRFFLIFLLPLALLSIQSCDKIDNPIKDDVDFVWNNRKIVIYDFTGHKCKNCPNGHKTLKNLTDLYGEAIVPIAIHCTYFAIPDNQYTYDFRTDIGDYLGGRDFEFGYYGELPLPIGLVNNLASENLSAIESWGTLAAKYVSLYPEFLINLKSEVSNDKISSEINITTNIANNRKLSVIAFLLEDKIYQLQYSSQGDIENYEHNHVLRAGFNGAFGEEIKNNNNTTSIGSEFTKSYSINISEQWNIENCSVVAFVYDTDTKEILQAEVDLLQKN